jgi:hypothetical protein
MALDLSAGIPVTGYAAALPWHERFPGAGGPRSCPAIPRRHGEVAGHRHACIAQEMHVDGFRMPGAGASCVTPRA